MLVKHHHVNKSPKIEKVYIRSMNILNEIELITNPHECSKGIVKTLEIKLKNHVVYYNH